jgi:hypothetical protein
MRLVIDKSLINLVILLVTMIPANIYSLQSTNNLSDDTVDPTIRILLITSPGEYAYEMAHVLDAMFGFDVDVTDTDQYAPLVDEYSYDGFVYMSGKYDVHPRGGLLKDMRETKKPVLWINYHAWLLGNDFFEAKGFVVNNVHSSDYTSLVSQVVYELSPTDTSEIIADSASVLYWLFTPSKQLVPAAVQSGNFTYLGYSPTLDTSRTDFNAFKSALNEAFGSIHSSGRKIWPDVESRIENARSDVFRTGIHLPVYVTKANKNKFPYDSDQLHSNLMRIKNSGAEWVSLVSVHYQDYVNSSKIYTDPERTATPELLSAVIDDAHKLGLMVRVFFVVNIAKPKNDEWRGFIRPKNKKLWWTSYNKHALKLATLAKDKGIESFVIGAELNSMQTDSDQWQRLVAKIRGDVGYRGLLGYQVNFDAMKLKWSDSLDFVGIAAYWPLAEERNPESDELNKSWLLIKEKLELWMENHPKVDLEFSEIGYVSQPYASVLPFSWNPFRGKTPSNDEQLKCYQALYKFLEDYKQIKGVHFFASTNEDVIENNLGYTPFGKPAQNVMNEIINLR